MSTPIEIVRAQSNWWMRDDFSNPPHTQDELHDALSSVLRDAERYEALELAHAGQPWEEFTTIMIAEYIHSKPGYEHVARTLAELADRLREGAK